MTLPFLPLFERERLARFRHFSTFAQIGGLILAGMALLSVLIVQSSEQNVQTVTQLHVRGEALLDAYRLWGGLVFFLTSLLMGAASISGEKSGGTFEHLILCPVGGRGLVIGKVMSSAAFLLILQLALVPLLFLFSFSCFVLPLQIGAVVVTHFLLTLQGTALGMWGAIRAPNLSRALGESIGSLLLIGMQLLFGLHATFMLVSMVGSFVAAILLALHLGTLYPWIATTALNIFLALCSIASGVTIFGSLAPMSLVRNLGANGTLIACGQIFCTALFVKWSVWQIDYPDRNFQSIGPATNAYAQMSNAQMYSRTASDVQWQNTFPRLKILYRHWNLALSPDQIEIFPRRASSPSPFTVRTDSLPTQTKSGKPREGGRIRIAQSKRLQLINPVLWLDLQRCLSLRSPHPSARLPLLLFATLGGSIGFAVALFTFVSLIQSVFTGTKGDVSSLRGLYDATRFALFYGALASGPIFAAQGFVIERKSAMLHELRLTLLSARALMIGKFGSRFCIPVIAALPLLALVAFFADNLPEENLWLAVPLNFALCASIAAFSISSCLWLSFHSRNELMAGVWCLAFAFGVGALLWRFPLALFDATFSSMLRAPVNFVPIYTLIAFGLSAHLFWRLKHIGFG